MAFFDLMVDKAFREEKAGRVVVFAGDRVGRGYIVRSESQEVKIRAVLRRLYFAQLFIFVVPAVLLAYVWTRFFGLLPATDRPVAMLAGYFGLYFGACFLLMIVPYLLILRSCKKTFMSFVSAEDEVEVSRRPVQRRVWIASAGALLLGTIALAIAIFLLLGPPR
jgi:hypothetical protein